jgi:hypothetical protein
VSGALANLCPMSISAAYRPTPGANPTDPTDPAPVMAVPFFAARCDDLREWQTIHPSRLAGWDPLPEGWVTEAATTLDSPIGLHGGAAQVRLVHRREGGWMIVHGVKVATNDQVVDAAEDFADLYAMVRDLATGINCTYHSFGDGFWWPATLRLLTEFLIPYYNPADPLEAAEQMVAALGGAPEVLPAALR